MAPARQSPPSSTSPVALLRRADFRQLYGVRLLSQGADGVFEATLVSFVVFSPERAASASAIAGALAVVLLPFSAIEPFTGILIDRVSRQRVLVVANAARVGIALLLAGLIAAHHSGPDFLIVALAVFSVMRFVLSALSAALPVVVRDPAALVTANSLSTTSGSVATLLGAGLGAGVRHVLGAQDSGVAVVAVVAAIGYLVAAAAATRIPGGALGPPSGQLRTNARGEVVRVARDMAAGAVYLARRPRARNALLALTVHRCCYGVSFVATVLLYRNYFHHAGGGLGGLAEILSAGGVGTIAAAFATPRATARLAKPTWISLLLGAACLAEIAFGFPYTTGWLLLAALVIGFVAQGTKICVDTMVQEDVADTFRGRAFSVYDLLFNSSYVAAAGLAAVAVPPNGKSYAVLGGIASGYGLAAIGYWLVSRGGARNSRAAREPGPTTAVGAVAAGGSAEQRPQQLGQK
ncbi:MAG: MFS transporter [Mycobacteriales bacterium]